MSAKYPKPLIVSCVAIMGALLTIIVLLVLAVRLAWANERELSRQNNELRIKP